MTQIDAMALGACLVLTAAAYIFGIQPLLDREQQQKEQEQTLAAKTAQANQSTAQLTALRNQLSKVRDAVSHSAIKLQSTAHLNQRLAEVTQMAGACGLQVNEIQPGAIVSGDRYETVPLHLAGFGAYEACAVFMHKLHQAFPDTGLSSFELTGTPNQPTNPAVFRFTLTWYAAPSLTADAEK
jgi:Tfp pilus assembly protein PilO